MADREIQNAQDNINRLRNSLNAVGEIDNTVEIEELTIKVRNAEEEIEVWLDEKFELESKVREIEAEVGPIKYIAELIYGETNPSIIDSAVRWLIIVFIFVFDPLAVILLLAANYSFVHRNDHSGRQTEIFETLFSKNEKKPLDKEEEISDNKEIDTDSEEVEESDEVVKDEIEKKEDNETVEVEETKSEDPSGVHLDPAEVDLKNLIENADEETLKKIKDDAEREINTKKEKKGQGWLDDLGKGFYK